MPFVLSLSALTLLLTASMVLLPALLRGQDIRASVVPEISRNAPHWSVVRSGRGGWYLNGEALAASELALRLRSDELPPAGLRFFPSSRRSARDVAADLDWLKATSKASVRLQVTGLRQ